MASAVVLHSVFRISSNCKSCYSKHDNRAHSLYPSQFIHFQSLLSPIKLKHRKTLKFKAAPRICAAQSNFAKVVQTTWKMAKDGIEAGTNLVPDSVPRPVAKISVTVVIGALVLFAVKSVLSTAFFVLAMMGLIYFTYIALNKDEGPKGGGGGGGGGSPSTPEDSLEEARRIMEKYK